ncbi:MAG: alpha-hydroxy acid oxidase [Actinomycetes bacterium]
MPQPPADDLRRTASVEDLHGLARERLDHNAYDYFRSGAGTEWTLRENEAAYRRWTFAKQVLVDVSAPDLSVDLLGTRLEVPVVVAPTAMHQLAHPDGEVATARAALDQGSLMVVSTLSNRPLEDVAATGVPRWFQLYVQKDRGATRALVDRAAAAGYTALALTVDTPELGNRWSDVRRPFTMPAGLGLGNLGNADPSADGAGLKGFATAFDPSLDWSALEWLADVGGLPVLVKGVLTAEDARRSVEHGAAGVWVSNHGGRQLDGDPATVEALTEVVDAVDGRVPVVLDGGVRTGSDVVVALCLGATAVAVGRPVLWGLASAGQPGAARALELLQTQTVDAVRQLGAPTHKDLTPERLRRRG